MLLTVEKLKEKYKGIYNDVEIFYNEGMTFRGTVSCEFDSDISDRFEVLDFKLADEEYYKNYIADRRIAVDFKDFYGNKSAKVLCILVPAKEAIQRDKNIVRRKL